MATEPTTTIFMPGPTIVVEQPGNVRDENHLPAVRRWNDRRVTDATLQDTLREESVPVALIDRIAFPQPAADLTLPPIAALGTNPAPAKQAELLSLIPENVEKPKVDAEFVTTLLNKPHMLMLRFRKGDLPFPTRHVCERMDHLTSRLTAQKAVLARTTSAIAEEATSSCTSKCMPNCPCTRGEKRATKYALLLLAIMVYVELLNLPVADLLRAYPTLLTLYYVFMGAAPAIGVGARLYSSYQRDVAEDAHVDAENQRHAAQIDFDAASAEMDAFLKENRDHFQELALDLLHDWIDARPLSRESGEGEYADLLAKAYRVGKNNLPSRNFATPEETEVHQNNDFLKAQCMKMELQAGLISHYARYYFNTGHALLLEEMRSLMPVSLGNFPSELTKQFTGVIPLIVPSTNIPKHQLMMLEYDMAVAQQKDFIAAAKSAIAKKDKLSPGNYLRIDCLPLSCGSFAHIYPLWVGQRRGSIVARSSPPREKDDEKRAPAKLAALPNQVNGSSRGRPRGKKRGG